MSHTPADAVDAADAADAVDTMMPTAAAAVARTATTTMTLAAAKQQLRTQMRQTLRSMPPATVAAQSAAIHCALNQFPPFVAAFRIAVFLSMPAAEVQTDAIVRHALAAGKQVFVPYLHRPAAAIFSGDGYAPPRVMDMVQLRDLADYEALSRDRWGIPSIDDHSVASRCRILGDGSVAAEAHPGDHADGTDTTDTAGSPFDLGQSVLDLILMPGVAFDVDPATKCIHRCGHGKGFYDFFLHRYAQRLQTSSILAADAHPVRLYGLAFTEQVLPAGSVPTDLHDKPLDGLIVGDGTVVVPHVTATTHTPLD